MKKIKLGKQYVITVGGSVTTEEALKRPHGYVNRYINSENFPLRKGPESQRTLEVIKDSEFDHEPSKEEVIEEATRRGLRRPTYEDALRFDQQYREEQGWYVFLHEPWQMPDGGGPRTILLYRTGSGMNGVSLDCTGLPRNKISFVFIRESS